MSRYKAGTFSGQELIDEFDLQQGSDVGSGFNQSAGATDGNKTKGNASLGDGYLTNETYEKLKGDARIKEAYASINGQDAADKKFKDGYISINTMDALFDNLTKQEQAEAQVEAQAKPPVVLSDRAAEAIAGSKAYEDVFLPRQGDYIFGKDPSVVSDFENEFTLNLAKAKSPQPQEPAELQNAEVKAEQDKVMDYANNYKKAVGDTLRPSNRF
jgi:hypothetical protein